MCGGEGSCLIIFRQKLFVSHVGAASVIPCSLSAGNCGEFAAGARALNKSRAKEPHNKPAGHPEVGERERSVGVGPGPGEGEGGGEGEREGERSALTSFQETLKPRRIQPQPPGLPSTQS